MYASSMQSMVPSLNQPMDVTIAYGVSRKHVSTLSTDVFAYIVQVTKPIWLFITYLPFDRTNPKVIVTNTRWNLWTAETPSTASWYLVVQFQ